MTHNENNEDSQILIPRPTIDSYRIDGDHSRRRSSSLVDPDPIHSHDPDVRNGRLNSPGHHMH